MRRLLPALGILVCGSSCWLATGCCCRGDETLIPYLEEGGDEWGYVDLAGNVVIEPDFDEPPTLFHEGFALVQDRHGEYTFIDRKGEEVSDEYEQAMLFNEGLAFVVEEGDPPVAINTRFEVIFELDDAITVGAFSEGLARFSDEDGEWGYVDKKGEVVIEPHWSHVSSFREGLAGVLETDEDRSEFRFGFIDKTGAEVIKPDDDYEGILSFSEGLAGFTEGDGWGYMDKTGEEVIRPEDDWSRVTPFVNGHASFQERGEWGLIDKKGERVLKAKYEHPLFFHNGLAMFSDGDDGWGFLDIHGDEVIEPEYESVALPFVGRCAIVQDGNDYEFIDKKGASCSDLEMERVDQTLAVQFMLSGRLYEPDTWTVTTDDPPRGYRDRR